MGCTVTKRDLFDRVPGIAISDGRKRALPAIKPFMGKARSHNLHPGPLRQEQAGQGKYFQIKL